MDRMRESLFSILGPLDAYSFLDLFSGSGLVGIEAASRGADPVLLVELDRKKRPVIMKNISMVETSITLVMMRVERFLKQGRGKFDIIYLDPPFPMKNKEGLISGVARSSLIHEESRVIIHHPAEEKWPERIETLSCYDERRYGRSLLRFFKSGLKG